MLKKTLGISFVAASTLLAAVALSSGGCSSTAVTTADDSGAATDGKKDTGPKADGAVDPGECPGAAPTKADLDQSGGWKAPPQVQQVCTAADITAFEANFKGATKFSDLIKGIPAACGSCILGKEDDATWNFVVTDAAGDLGFFNYGACYARAAGGSEACGKAVQYGEFCINSSCNGCASAEDNTACRADEATQTACSANFQADLQAGCGTDTAKLKALDTACSKPTLAVGVLCGGGTPIVDSGAGG
jgi:hypothetical protein